MFLEVPAVFRGFPSSGKLLIFTWWNTGSGGSAMYLVPLPSCPSLLIDLWSLLEAYQEKKF